MNPDDMQKFGKGSMDMAMNAAGAWSKTAQAITVEFVEYTKKTAEASAAAWEKLLGAKSLEKAIEVQTEYLRSSYEDFVAEAAKLGELYTDMARQTYQPFESALRK
jgi:phasin family protein